MCPAVYLNKMAFSFAPILDPVVFMFYISTTVFILRFGLILTTSTKISNSGKPKSGTDEACKGLWLRDIINISRQVKTLKHLQNSERCRALCSVECFHILDHASTSFQLKIKEAIHIQREQPSLNQQSHDVNLKLSFYLSHCHVFLYILLLLA